MSLLALFGILLAAAWCLLGVTGSDGEAGREGTFTINGASVDVRDIDVQIRTVGRADTTSRASSGWAEGKPSRKEWMVNFTMVFDSSDTTAYDTLVNAMLNDTLLSDCAVKRSDGSGFTGDAWVDSVSVPQPHDDEVTVDVTLRGEGAPTKNSAGS